MSSKASIYYTDEMHFFRECFLDESLFIKFNKKDLKLELEFNILDFLKMAKSFDFESFEKQASVTDEQIIDYCTKIVSERLEKKNTFNIMGYMVFGEIDLSKENQIQKGFEFYCKKRDKLKKFLEEYKQSNVGKLYFGLEHIIS